MKVTNVRWLIWFALVLAGCQRVDQPRNQEPKRLTVLTWSDYFGSTTLKSFTDSTGIEVVVDYIDSNEELIAKLENQPDQYDLVFPSAYAVSILEQKGLLGRVDRHKLPNVSNLLSEYRTISGDPDGIRAVPYTVSFTAIGVDTVAVRQPVTGYESFFRVGGAPRILLLDDMRATIGMALKARGYSANSSDSVQLAAAERALRTLRPQVHVFASSDLQQLMASGEVTLSYAWSGDILQAARMRPSMRLVNPTEGTLLYIDCMAIPVRAQRPNNAHLFINHILSARVAAEISNEILYLTPNAASEPYLTREARSIWASLQEMTNNPRTEQVAYVGSAVDLYSQAWNRIKGR